jgi:hypothetical protein
MERWLALVWKKCGGSRLKMIWLGRKMANRAALTCVVNQFGVSSRTRPELLREQNTLPLALLLDHADAGLETKGW